MKWRYVVLVLLGVSASAVAEAETDAEMETGAEAEKETEWQVTPPAGWVRNNELETQFKAGRGPGQHVKSELRLWMPPDASAMLMVDWFVVNLGHRTDQEIIETLDSTTFTGTGISARADRPERTIGSLVIRDSTAMSSGMLARHVRHFQRAPDGLHVMTAMCTSREMKLCNASLEGAALKIARATADTTHAARDGGDRTADKADGTGKSDKSDKSGRPSTYRIGQIVGVVGVLGLGLGLLLRRRQRR